jgi:MFS family permease
MPILALSRVDPTLLKPSIRIGLLVLPLVIGGVLCYPAYLLLVAVLPAIGIDPDAPIRGQSRGGLAAVIIIAVILAGFIGGYIVGFFANAAVCRFVLSWPKEQVVAVFLRSEMPQHWYKNQP